MSPATLNPEDLPVLPAGDLAAPKCDAQYMKSLKQLHASVALLLLLYSHLDCRDCSTQLLIQQHDWLFYTTSEYLAAASFKISYEQ